MKSFNQYMEARIVAEFLVENGIPSSLFVEAVMTTVQQNGKLDESVLYNELLRNILGGISNLARGAAGVGNVVGNLASGAGRAIGQGAAAAGRGLAAAGSAVGNAAANAGRAVGGAVASGAKAVGNAAQQAGQYVGDVYQQGAQRETLKQALNAVQGLQDQLTKAGLDGSQIQMALRPLQQVINQHMTNVNADRSYRVANNNLQQPQQAQAAA